MALVLYPPSVDFGLGNWFQGAQDADPEVWYEELDAAAVHELEAMTSEHDSQSEGEQDYPDEESEVDSADSADDDYDGSQQWRASRRGGSDDYLNMVW